MAEKIIKHDEKNPSPIGLYYNVWFKPRTDCSALDEKYRKSLVKFQIIFASDEAAVYQICHHLYSEFDLSASSIKTIDGLAIESYFDPYSNHKYNMIQMEKLLNQGVLKDIAGKWIVIPKMSSQWTPRLAYLFYNEIRESGAVGMIFHSSGLNDLGSVLIENTLLDVLQFPEKVYQDKNSIKANNY